MVTCADFVTYLVDDFTKQKDEGKRETKVSVSDIEGRGMGYILESDTKSHAYINSSRTYFRWERFASC